MTKYDYGRRMPVQKALKILQWILTVATVGIILILCWQCLDIYLVGNSPENINAGVYLSPVYTAQNVSERLGMASPFLALYAVLAGVTVIAHLLYGKAKRPSGKVRPCPPRKQMDKPIKIARISVFVLGVLFIVLGMMNGGARDVLIKAINICTECIGLG